MAACRAVLNVESNVAEWANALVLRDYFRHYVNAAIYRKSPDSRALWPLMVPMVLFDNDMFDVSAERG